MAAADCTTSRGVAGIEDLGAEVVKEAVEGEVARKKRLRQKKRKEVGVKKDAAEAAAREVVVVDEDARRKAALAVRVEEDRRRKDENRRRAAEDKEWKGELARRQREVQEGAGGGREWKERAVAQKRAEDVLRMAEDARKKAEAAEAAAKAEVELRKRESSVGRGGKASYRGKGGRGGGQKKASGAQAGGDLFHLHLLLRPLPLHFLPTTSPIFMHHRHALPHFPPRLPLQRWRL